MRTITSNPHRMSLGVRRAHESRAKVLEAMTSIGMPQRIPVARLAKAPLLAHVAPRMRHLIVFVTILSLGCSSAGSLGPQETASPALAPRYPAVTSTLSEVISDVQGGVVAIRTPAGTGSGFIIDANGTVLTNAHVVGAFHKATVAVQSPGAVDSISITADVTGVSEDVDLALLSLGSGRSYPHLEFGDSDLVTLGQDVITIGFPLSDVLGKELAVTRGIVSSRRHIAGLDWIQTDAAVNPGNSGGPLLNSSGRVIGVTTAKIKSILGQPVEGIGFALSINAVREMLPSLRVRDRSISPQSRRYEGEIYNASNDLTANLTLLLKQDGETLTGEVEVFPPLQGDGPITGTLRGTRIDFAVSFRLSQIPYTITFSGALLADGTLAGAYDVTPSNERGSWVVRPP